MRLRSDIVVSALIRRVFAGGATAAVLRKGAQEAGAIFLRLHSRSGSVERFGPAPQSLVDDDGIGGRLFEPRLEDVQPSAVDDALAREIRFDPDCWVVELEIDGPGDLFDIIRPVR